MKSLTYQDLLALLLLLLDEPLVLDVDVLVAVEPVLEAVVVAAVTALFEAQNDVYHVSMACRSAVAEQLALPQT